MTPEQLLQIGKDIRWAFNQIEKNALPSAEYRAPNQQNIQRAISAVRSQVATLMTEASKPHPTTVYSGDFAELSSVLNALTEDQRELVTVNIDEDIVRVIYNGDLLFSAGDCRSFVSAFFAQHGINIDGEYDLSGETDHETIAHHLQYLDARDTGIVEEEL